MNRPAVALAAGCVAVLAAAAAPGASGATLDTLRSGWWTAGASPVVPASVSRPTVPPGGIDVANAFTGPYSVAAVHVPLAGGPVTAVLTLKLATGATPNPSIRACPTTTRWTPASGGALADAPHDDCTHAVLGAVSPDGTTISWTLPPGLARSGAFDVALVPGGQAGPFDAPMEPVTPASVTFPTAAGPSGAGGVAPTPPAGSPPASSGSAEGPPAGAPGAPDPGAGAPGGPGLTGPSGNAVIGNGPAAQLPAAALPGATLPATGLPTGGAAPAPAFRAPAASRKTSESGTTRLAFGLLLAGLLGAAGVGLLRTARSGAPEPSEVRGIGRFATTHPAPPRPL